MIAEQLKKSILQYAIQGKLTEQLIEDGNARDLLYEIQKEKTRLINEGKIKRQKPLPEIKENEVPFDIPDNWCWVRLGEVTEVKGGKRIPVGKKLTKENTGYKYIRVADMQNGSVIDTDIHYVPADVYPKIRNYTISSGDIYITCAGSIGRVGVIPEVFNEANLTENADKLTFWMLNKGWLVFALDSPFVQSEIAKVTTKVGQPKLAIKRIKNLILPLPTMKEQHRIVERLEEIILEVEKLEKDELNLDTLQKSFPKKMKDSILQYAVQGKLTEQLKSDGNARDLLKEIQKEKIRLIKEGKVKKKKPLPEIKKDDIPFDIPENWCWVRFGNVVNYQMGKTPPRQESSYWGNDIPWVSIADMFENGVIIHTKENISSKAFKQIFKKNISPKGTLIMSFKLTIGRVSILGLDATHNEAIISIFPNIKKDIFKQYLFKILPMVSKWGHSKDAIKGKTLNSTSLNNMMFPLPPLAEQRRIVERLDQLLPLCSKIDELCKR
jgi:type I restriction enzyme, S subunit